MSRRPLPALLSLVLLACGAGSPAAKDPPADLLGCYRLGTTPPGSIAYGKPGDALCLERDRLLVVMSQGEWNGWPILWKPAGKAWRVQPAGTALVERSSLWSEVQRAADGSVTIHYNRDEPTPLTALAPAEQQAAAARAKALDVKTICERARACFAKVTKPEEKLTADHMVQAWTCSAYLDDLADKAKADGTPLPAECQADRSDWPRKPEP